MEEDPFQASLETCRLCMKKENLFIGSLFALLKDSLSISEKIMAIAAIKVYYTPTF